MAKFLVTITHRIRQYEYYEVEAESVEEIEERLENECSGDMSEYPGNILTNIDVRDDWDPPEIERIVEGMKENDDV